MKSILAFKNNETDQSKIFSSSVPVSPSILFSIHLTRSFKLSPKRSLFHIILPNLLEISEGYIQSCTDLTLSLFEAFTEDTPSGKKFGFSLNSQIFYTDSESDLLTCTRLFTQVCIFTHIEDEYVFLKEIGSGSTSTVYLAQNQDKEEFAVKCVHKSNLVKPQSLKNLRNEICIMRQIEHPNVCKLFAVYEDEKEVYLVMEYLPYGNFLKRISIQGALSEEQALRLARNLLETLDYLHSRDIVHRDLKLENILMTKEGDFKIIDLGLAYRSSEPQKKKCGSPGYVAPEMLRCEEYNYKIDIFSAGVVLYILLHGEHPFEARNQTKVLMKNLECNVKVKKRISSLSKSIILLMLQPFPEDRPSAFQLLQTFWPLTQSKLLNVSSIATCLSSNPPAN